MARRVAPFTRASLIGTAVAPKLSPGTSDSLGSSRWIAVPTELSSARRASMETPGRSRATTLVKSWLLVRNSGYVRRGAWVAGTHISARPVRPRNPGAMTPMTVSSRELTRTVCPMIPMSAPYRLRQRAWLRITTMGSDGDRSSCAEKRRPRMGRAPSVAKYPPATISELIGSASVWPARFTLASP